MEVVKNAVKKFEYIIVIALLGMMVLVVFLSTIELAVILVEHLLSPPLLLLEIHELLKIFGFFLMILIGLELVETLKVYISEEIVHVEFVFLVAIIAVARKV
ncbi:MAG: phosphate-starvation-inducible PsiE family protein, partial [Deltaproteobacteria bacterium]|nr:phosphate-starvation-inducible PsiE family protein [Deltaproteobacteria bacterium]